MKKTFRKAVSVLLSVLMLVSLCTVAITSVSAEEITLADVGVYSGTAVMDDGAVSTDYLMTDPTGASTDPVIKTRDGDGRYNIRLADLEDPTKPFELTDGTYYTVTFDYYIESAGDAFMANGGAFDLRYALADTGTVDGIGRKEVSGLTRSDNLSGAALDSAVGDGKWHSASITFQAAVPVTYTDDTNTTVSNTFNNIYLTYYNAVSVSGYLKNITIVEETNATGKYSNGTYEQSRHVTADDVYTSSSYGSATSKNSTTGVITHVGMELDEDNNLVIIPSNNTTVAAGGTAWVQKRNVLTSTTASNRLSISNSKQYSVVVKYKIASIGPSAVKEVDVADADADGVTAEFTGNTVDIGPASKVMVGIGYNKNGTSNTGTQAYCEASMVYSTPVVTDDWKYLTATFTPSLDEGKTSTTLQILVAGAGAKIVIDYVQVAVTAMDNATLLTLNDNGEISVKAAYNGTDLPEGTNGAYGEKFMGWYSDANCTTAVAKVPETDGTLFAKYPTIVIDKFAMFPNYASGTQVSKSTWAESENGWSFSGTSGSGFLLPAYDDPNVAFYEFVPGLVYDVKIYFDSFTVTSSSATTAAINLYYGDGYGSNYVRTSQVSGASQSFGTVTEPTCLTFSFTHKTTTKTQNEVEHIVNTVILRPSGSASATGAINITKLEIIEHSDENLAYMPASITIDDGETQDSFYAYEGDLIVMPEAPAAAEGEMFIGWYSSNYDENASNKYMTTDEIPVSALTVDADMLGKTITYSPKYISTKTEIVDFEEEIYQGNDKSGNPWSETASSNADRSSIFTIVEDETTGDHYAFADRGGLSGNVFKMSLYTDDGSYIYAYEGVTYEITLVYESLQAGSNNTDGIGICRNMIKAFKPVALDGGTGCSVFGEARNLGEYTVTQTLRVENTYVAADGVTESGYGMTATQMSLMVRSGDVNIYSVSITPVSYTAPALQNVDLTKGDVDIDYENGTVTVTPNEGYEVSAAGITAIQSYNEYTLGENSAGDQTCEATENEVETFNLMPTKDGGSTDDGLTFKFDNTLAGARLSSYRFNVDFVEKNDATVNAAAIAASIRSQSGSGDNYVSAGIRFRFRASAQTVANASEIGFVIVPTKALTDAGVDTVEAYMAAGGGAQVTGVAKDATKDVVYAEIGDVNYYDYQAILTGLTDENGKDLTNLELSVAFTVTVGETTEYIEIDNSVKYSDYAN